MQVPTLPTSWWRSRKRGAHRICVRSGSKALDADKCSACRNYLLQVTKGAGWVREMHYPLLLLLVQNEDSNQRLPFCLFVRSISFCIDLGQSSGDVSRKKRMFENVVTEKLFLHAKAGVHFLPPSCFLPLRAAQALKLREGTTYVGWRGKPECL